MHYFCKGPFKYYVSKEVGGWGQKMAIFADLQYYLSQYSKASLLSYPYKC